MLVLKGIYEKTCRTALEEYDNLDFFNGLLSDIAYFDACVCVCVCVCVSVYVCMFLLSVACVCTMMVCA